MQKKTIAVCQQLELAGLPKKDEAPFAPLDEHHGGAKKQIYWRKRQQLLAHAEYVRENCAADELRAIIKAT
eukprot:12908793-Prorocentrum_lima.AAC.1